MNFRKTRLLLLLVLISGLSLTPPAFADKHLIAATSLNANHSEQLGRQFTELAIPLTA